MRRLRLVAGTNNWQLDISLTGTLDADYTMRVRRNSLMFDGMNVPAPALASAAFTIDTSLGVDAVLGHYTGRNKRRARRGGKCYI